VEVVLGVLLGNLPGFGFDLNQLELDFNDLMCQHPVMSKDVIEPVTTALVAELVGWPLASGRQAELAEGGALNTPRLSTLVPSQLVAR
jgi:hypothetical protein